MTKKKTTKKKKDSGLGKSKIGSAIAGLVANVLVAGMVQDLLIGKPEATKTQRRYYVFSEIMVVISLAFAGIEMFRGHLFSYMVLGLLGVYYFATCLQFVKKFKSNNPLLNLMPEWLR